MTVDDHTLEFLLAFDGQRHWLEDGYFLKFEIARVVRSEMRPHGIKYSLTLHGPNGDRLMGFDNAHSVEPIGSTFKERPAEADHWHRTDKDTGRPYEFKDAETLIADFFTEARRILVERGVAEAVIDVEGEGDTS